MSSRGRMNPSELPILLTSSFMAASLVLQFVITQRITARRSTVVLQTQLCAFVYSKLSSSVDHPLDHAEPALPERRIARVEPERREQFGIMLGAAG